MRIKDVRVGDQFRAPKDRIAGIYPWITVDRIGPDGSIWFGTVYWNQRTLDVAIDEMGYEYLPVWPVTILYPEGV